MQTIYQEIGAEKLRELVAVFYQNMDTLDEAKTIRVMHAKNLRVSKNKLFMFLSGFFGGPNLYVEKYGHPRLRGRHLPFKIGTDEANQWLLCMRNSLDKVIEDAEITQEMMNYFTRTALHMRNQSENSETAPIRWQNIPQ